MEKEYKFRVGTRPLSGIKQFGAKKFVSPQDKAKVCHACILIGTDLFEYNLTGYSRHEGVGQDSEFEWEKLGSKVNGTTYVTPDELENAIKNDETWGPRSPWGLCHYHPTKHNCHHFVMFCLEQIGAGHFYRGYTHYLMDLPELEEIEVKS